MKIPMAKLLKQLKKKIRLFFSNYVYLKAKDNN